MWVVNRLNKDISNETREFIVSRQQDSETTYVALHPAHVANCLAVFHCAVFVEPLVGRCELRGWKKTQEHREAGTTHRFIPLLAVRWQQP